MSASAPRRRVLKAIGLGALSVSWRALADDAKKDWSVSLLIFGRRQDNLLYQQTLEPELKSQAVKHGRKLTFHAQYADQDPARLQALAESIVAARPDAVIAMGTTVARLLARLTSDIPIVAGVADPVRDGLAASYARPGGNVTGITGTLLTSAPKSLDVLTQLAPRVKGFTLLVVASKAAGASSSIYYLRNAARSLGLEMREVQVANAEQVDGVFNALRPRAGTWAVCAGTEDLPPDPARRAASALECGVPLFSAQRDDVAAGALFSYAAGFRDGEKQISDIVVNILLGAPPGQVPFRLPDTHELWLNRQTAAKLGLTIPAAVELLATRTID